MNKITQKQIDTFKLLVEEKNHTITMACKITGIPVKNTHYYIKTRNIKVKRKGQRPIVNDKYFNNIDSENKAYILGFFLADGTISSEKRKKNSPYSNRIGFNNSIDDLEIIEKIRDEISPDSNIQTHQYNRGALNRKPQATLRITSNEIIKTLKNDFNISQNKTFNINFKFNFDKIPNHLIRHFIRGFFDGDGSVSFYLVPKRRTMFFNFSFVFTSLDFTNQIGNLFAELFNIKPVIYKKIGKTVDWYSLRFNYYQNRTDKIKEIYKYLYQDSNIFLKRKRNKFDEYLEYRAN